MPPSSRSDGSAGWTLSEPFRGASHIQTVLKAILDKTGYIRLFLDHVFGLVCAFQELSFGNKDMVVADTRINRHVEGRLPEFAMFSRLQ